MRAPVRTLRKSATPLLDHPSLPHLLKHGRKPGIACPGGYIKDENNLTTEGISLLIPITLESRYAS